MAASYPTGFDTMSDPGTNLSGPPTHATMHNQVNDVIEAIEAELGLNPSGSSATVAARFTAVDNYAKGKVGYAEVVVAQSTASTSVVDVAGTTVTWTAVSTRVYKVTAGVLARNSAASLYNIYIADGGNTVLALDTDHNSPANVDILHTLTRVFNGGVSGTVSVKLRCNVVSTGTLTLNNTNNSTTPTFVLVEDIGAA